MEFLPFYRQIRANSRKTSKGNFENLLKMLYLPCVQDPHNLFPSCWKQSSYGMRVNFSRQDLIKPSNHQFFSSNLSGLPCISKFDQDLDKPIMIRCSGEKLEQRNQIYCRRHDRSKKSEKNCPTLSRSSLFQVEQFLACFNDAGSIRDSFSKPLFG